MDIKVRTAVKDDCVRIIELVYELAIYEKAPEQVTVTLEEFTEAGFGLNPVWKAFVATDHNLIIGFALFYTRFSTWKGRRLYLEDFLITETHRGKGIGKLLFERVIQEAKENDYNGMSWQVLDWNEQGLNFYQKYNAQIESGWLNASFSTEQINESK
jgi:GNAT superfamily N-acetyltransferase